MRRVVHVSITNPSEDSPLPYFHGKARLERALIESSLSYAILRPAVLFGKEDILINNIAWALRHLPLFGLFGDGSYRLQPIYVDDLAGLAVEAGVQISGTAQRPIVRLVSDPDVPDVEKLRKIRIQDSRPTATLRPLGGGDGCLA